LLLAAALVAMVVIAQQVAVAAAVAALVDIAPMLAALQLPTTLEQRSRSQLEQVVLLATMSLLGGLAAIPHGTRLHQLEAAVAVKMVALAVARLHGID
jgi:hypothetical protein